jgi:hypothetical protein
MIRETISNAHPEGNIYEQFAYLYNSVGYPNSSDITKLFEIWLGDLEKGVII